MLSALLFSGLAAGAITLPGSITIPVTTQTSFAAPACTKGPSSTQQFTVNYNFETVERADPLTGLIPIGVYNLLNFKNIQWVDTDPDFDGNHLGLAPKTYPDAATFGAGVDALTNSTPAITVDYVESTISAFTPHSFWYGCVLPSPYTAGSLPINCTITATGYSKSGAKLASQQFPFKTNGSVVQDQLEGVFNKKFKGVHTLGFSVTNSDEAAALVDNFIATLEQQSCAPLYGGSY